MSPKSSTTAIFLGAGALIAYSLYRKSAAAGDLVFYAKGIRSLDWDSGSPIIVLNLGIANTSNQSFDVNALAGELWTNNTYIGYVSSFNRIVVNAVSEGVIPIRIQLSMIGLVSELINGITNGTWTQNLELDLKANIDNLVVTIPTIKYKIGS